MQLPLEITFRNAERSDVVEDLIREKAAKLDRVHRNIMSCRVAVEKRHSHQRTGSGWHVTIDLRVPPGHEIVVTRDSSAGEEADDAYRAVQEAFEAARKRLTKLADLQRGEVKKHPAQEVRGFVSKLFPDYGFIETVSGSQLYFHQNALVGGDFGDLQVGTGVTYTEEPGDEGPQASSVRILDDRPLREEGGDVSS